MYVLNTCTILFFADHNCNSGNTFIIINVYVFHLIFQEVGLFERLQNQKKQLKAELRRAEEEKRRLLEEVDNLVQNVEVLVNLGKQYLAKE